MGWTSSHLSPHPFSALTTWLRASVKSLVPSRQIYDSLLLRRMQGAVNCLQYLQCKHCIVSVVQTLCRGRVFRGAQLDRGCAGGVDDNHLSLAGVWRIRASSRGLSPRRSESLAHVGDAHRCCRPSAASDNESGQSVSSDGWRNVMFLRPGPCSSLRAHF